MPDPKKPGSLWQISPNEPITFHAELKPDLLVDGEVPSDVQVAIRNAVRHAVISTLEAHGLLDRTAPVDFIPDTVKPPVGAADTVKPPRRLSIETVKSGGH